MESQGVLHALQKTFIVGFLRLPILLIGFIGFLAVTIGNIGLFMLFMGHATVLPIAVWLVQLLLTIFTEKGNPLMYVASSDIGRLVPGPEPGASSYQMVVPSYWLSHIWFFLTYLFTNAATIYNMDSAPNAAEAKVENRKARSLTIMIVTLVGAVLLTALRYAYTNTETMLGLLVSAAMSIGLGVGWYYFAAICGAAHSDVFGIVSQVLSTPADQKPPVTCVYSASP